MSERDLLLVKQLGIPVSQIAAELNVSRQAVSKGLTLDDDYFRPSSLAILLNNWQEINTPMFNLARSAIREIYKEDARAILSSVNSSAMIGIDTSMTGEFTLVTGEIESFIDGNAICIEQLEDIFSNFEEDGGLFEVVVNSSDQRYAHRYFRAMIPDYEKFFNIIVCAEDLNMVPATLLRISDDFRTDLFGCSTAGFVTLTTGDAKRIRKQIDSLR